MPAAQCNATAGLIGALCREPGRYSFFQAVELLLAWLSDCHRIPRRQALDRLVRFENSRGLAFPTGDLGAVSIAANADAAPHAALTALFMGFTGTHGALPNHYTARLAADRDGETQALLDVFSNRFVRHFYTAWRKHRMELPSLGEGPSDLQRLLLALSGNSAAPPVEENVAAYYTGALRQRPASAAMLQGVLNDAFRLPITVAPNVGYWHDLEPHQLARLGSPNCTLDGRMVLGRRLWRRDARVSIRIGPLCKARYDSLLPDGASLPRLRALLSMFHMPGIEFEIVLMLAAADVRPFTLSSNSGESCRLGYDAFLVREPGLQEREYRYLLPLS